MITRRDFLGSLPATSAMLAVGRGIFTTHSGKTISLPLSLRIPGWCSTPDFYLNEKLLPPPQIERGFARLDRKFHPGDKITLVLPMKAALSRWPDNGVGVEHGPLVYSFPIKEAWASLVIPKYSTQEFPAWNAQPASAWNYGLALDEARLNSEIRIQRKRMTEDPWIEPPISATVPLKQISGWKIESDPKDENQKFTPALADVAKVSVAYESERKALAPYGSTHLRLTIFPDLSVSNSSARFRKPA